MGRNPHEMAEVVIALGSNLGDRLEFLRSAGHFLSGISGKPVAKSSIWESEPVGPAEHNFLNSVALITSRSTPQELLRQLKEYERESGRDPSGRRWGPRCIDLDIIAWEGEIVETKTLRIPHPEYRNRLFVLLPLRELRPGWSDPRNRESIDRMILSAPEMGIRKTGLTW